MAYSLITSVGASSSNGTSVTSGAIDTTGANFIVIGVVDVDGGAVTPTDSKSNTWTGLTAQTNSNLIRCKLWYAYAPTVGTGHTFSLTGVVPAIIAAAFSGAASSPFDLQDGNNDGIGTSNISPANPITPSEDNELVIVIAAQNDTTSDNVTINQSYTEIQDLADINGTCVGGMMAYRIYTTAAATQPTVSFETFTDAAIAIASFKAAGSGLGRLLLRTPA